MEAAVILFVLLHCGQVEALIRDTSEKAGAAGARVITIEVKDDKCAVST